MLRERRFWAMAALGFAAGLPFPLSGFTFRLWMAENGLTVSAIGLTAYIGLAYSLKFLWSPLFDRATPGPLRRLGRRRGWLVLVQPALIASAAVLALSEPKAAPLVAVAAAVAVAFCSASQDILIDAWRIETFGQREQGIALSAYVWGYRVALLVSTSGAIAMAGRIGWHAALLAMAALLAVGLFATLALAPAESTPEAVGVRKAGWIATVRETVFEPLRDFLTRPYAWTILAFVALFKLGEAMAGIMTAPFYRSLGFSRDAIAGNGPFSLTATLAGIAVGGWIVARIGVGKALIATGWAQTVAMAMYVVLARSPGNLAVLYGTVSIEAFAQGVADAAFLTYLSGLCSRRFTATQYALLSSVPQLAIHTIGAQSGKLVAAVGWTEFYALCIVTALPAMGLMLYLLRKCPPEDAVAKA